MVHLVADGPQPIEYLRYRLMKEFGWTPAELRGIPLPEILQLLTCMKVEGDYATLQS